ncbi:hypothetical protein [Chryseobacterium sp. R2A-55]|uniref:hypothetical protein n=1 Tax=Chryseobacterium sp. R2A-55 TaxID=2744445 RepID=UPI001F3EE108|nr:hypothetical protein [Chryseobacterium sp. R2A-55]
MQPEEFSKLIDKKASELRTYAETRFPSKAGNIALRFVNGNFRAQGFQGTTFKKWKPNKRGGTVLVKTGQLRAATFFTSQNGQVTIKNHMKYAKAHNEGFNGTVLVKSHSRNKYSKTQVGTGKFSKAGKERMRTMTMKSGEMQVRAHTRKMKIAQRQFIPTENSRSPVLENAVLREVTRDIKQILNK